MPSKLTKELLTEINAVGNSKEIRKCSNWCKVKSTTILNHSDNPHYKANFPIAKI